MAEIISTVGPFLGLDFSNIITAEAFADDVAGDHIFECKGDVLQLLVVSGWQSGSSLVVRPMRGEKHDGITAESGAHLTIQAFTSIANSNELPVTFDGMGFLLDSPDDGQYVQVISYSSVGSEEFIIRGCLFDFVYTSQVTTSSGNAMITFEFAATGETVIITRNLFRFRDQGNSSTDSIGLFRWHTNGTRAVTFNNNTMDVDTDSSDAGSMDVLYNGNAAGTTLYNNVIINQGDEVNADLIDFNGADTGNNFHGGDFTAANKFETGGVTSSDFEDLAGFGYTPTRDGLLFGAAEITQANKLDIVGRYVPQGNFADVGAFERKRDKGARSRGNSNGRVLLRSGWRRP